MIVRCVELPACISQVCRIPAVAPEMAHLERHSYTADEQLLVPTLRQRRPARLRIITADRLSSPAQALDLVQNSPARASSLPPEPHHEQLLRSPRASRNAPRECRISCKWPASLVIFFLPQWPAAVANVFTQTAVHGKSVSSPRRSTRLPRLVQLSWQTSIKNNLFPQKLASSMQ